MSDGADIRQLDDDTIRRIAAGEVVERPASVVKELVENSLDAGASRVEVEVERGGIDGIRVSDDGSGIAPESLQLAVGEHATSKIEDIEDLEAGVGTLGFRGEALHTVGAVSRLTIRSKPAAGSEPGHEITVEGGEISTAEPTGCPTGTTVAVDDLFYNTPARRKFLKTETTEFDHINTVVTQYALANPDVAVSLTHDGRETFATEGTGELRSAVLAVYGREVAEAMIEIDVVPEGPVDQVRGLISHPETTRAGREYLATFVNDRYVTASVLREAVVDAYGNQLAPDRYPFAVLFVDVPPAAVDVNVHPRKMEVRFDAEVEVQSAVQSAVHDGLMDHGLLRSTAPRGRSAPDEVDLSTAASQQSDEREPDAQSADDSATEQSGSGVTREAAESPSRADSDVTDDLPSGDGANPDHPDSPDPEAPSGDGDPVSLDAETVDPDDERAWTVEGIGGDTDVPGGNGVTESDENRISETSSSDMPGTADRTAPTGATEENGETPATGTGGDLNTPTDTRSEINTPVTGSENDVGADPLGTDSRDTETVSHVTDQETLTGETTTAERAFERLPSLRLLGQFQDTYIVAEAPEGLVLIDQHAADERVAYERLRERFSDGTTTQTLASPITIELTAREAALFDEYVEALERLGFQASRADQQSVQVEAVPAVFETALDPELLRDALSAFVRDGNDAPETVDGAADDLLADLACYPAVTGNTSLTEGSVVELLETLDDCENPYACPHGRPVIIEFDQDELADRFERDYPGHAGRRR